LIKKCESGRKLATKESKAPPVSVIEKLKFTRPQKCLMKDIRVLSKVMQKNDVASVFARKLEEELSAFAKEGYEVKAGGCGTAPYGEVGNVHICTFALERNLRKLGNE